VYFLIAVRDRNYAKAFYFIFRDFFTEMSKGAENKGA
jgi:hypothetical protein